MTLIYTDGTSKGRFGYLVEGKKPKIFTEKGLTTNEAEYKAIIKALESRQQDEEVYLFSDSIIAINQIIGTWGVREQRLRDLKQVVWTIVMLKYLDVRFNYIARRNNKMVKILRGNHGRNTKSRQPRTNQNIQFVK